MKRVKEAGVRIAGAWFHASGKDALKRGGLSAGVREQWSRITALGRMLRAWGSGQYKDIPARTLLLSVFALAYFVSPIDLIPDFIPALGLLDDATVILLVLGAIEKDLDRFQAWEARERHTIEAENPSGAIS